ncbi:MAG TPA: protein DA1 [Ktedonobacteraceae bacterium]|nr:protein DA1 [Ktedonobacteraceae bacterium]
MPLCHYCGQPVWGSYVTALGATWHPEHFLCARCGQPIYESTYQVSQGKPYHQACYLVSQAPCCAYCSQPISGSYVESSGRAYHTECFREHVVPHCVYCGKSLSGRYLVDAWGNTYCPEHQQEYPRCSFCGRLIPPAQQTPGWDDFESLRCSVCRSTAIETSVQAQPLFQQCKQWIAQQGFRFNQLPLSLVLRDRTTLAGMLQGRAVNHPLGVTLSSTRVQNGYALGSHIEGVAVLQGMPATLFAGVVLHELGHVWLTAHGIERLPAWAEEGFGQLLSYRYYTDLNTLEARYYAGSLENDTDPIYGDGFRQMRALAERVGFRQLLETLLTTKKLPL